ncbi:MAG TPA: hypothetical protein VM737_10890 [Gemmatimonadota bacterium]|nr:hypothetical protein [Gemmatimonadota bacterium]
MKSPFPFVPLLVAVLAGALAACTESPAESGVRLRLRYEIGDTLHYEYVATGTVTMPDSAGPVTESYERRLRVDEVATDATPRGNYMLAWTYHLTHDTLGSATAVPMQFTVHVEISPQGKIVNVENVETARPLFGDLDFRTYLEQTQPVFPERPLTVGDSWTQEVKVLSPQAEPVITSSTYVLEALRSEAGELIAVIAFDGDVYLPVVYESDGEDEDEELRSVEERIGVRGRMFFAHERGLVRRVDSDAQATMTKISFRADRPIRREIEITQESTLRLIDRE